MKTRYLKARLPDPEYDALKTDADLAGLTISEHTRSALLRDRGAKTQANILALLEVRLAQAPVASHGAAGADLEPLLTEVLLLAREIAAERNAQVLARVAQQLNHLFPKRSLS